MIKEYISNRKVGIRDLFYTPIDNVRKYLIVLLVAFLFIWVPQIQPTDWDLNTVGFWSDIPHTYKNQNFVYPPWSLILMLPYKLMHAEGARIFSVLVVGWLSVRQKWSLSVFIAIILSPFFLLTMTKSNLDIFVFVLPILIWDVVTGTALQDIGWGMALSILLVKPQGAIFIGFYLLWSSRNIWKELCIPITLVALVTIPVSLIGSPPLFIQWLNNIAHPSNQNQLYWATNNISLSAKFNFPWAILILTIVSLILLLFVWFHKVIWTRNHTIASLLIVSMLLSPYASIQSVSPALAFIPSWAAVAIGYVVLIWGQDTPRYFYYLPLLVLFLAACSLLFFKPYKSVSNNSKRTSF